MEFIISETEEKKCLLHDGYVYRLDAVLNNQDSSWKCSNKNCRARVKTNHDGCTIIPVSCVKMRGSDTQAVTRRKEREKHQFLMRQFNKLLSGEIDRSEYVRSLWSVCIKLLKLRFS